jgi:hypothetical protein
MPSLLQISQELLQLEAELHETDGDADAQSELVETWLSKLDEREEKLDNYAALIRELELRAEARKQEANRLMALVKSDQQKADLLKIRLKYYFQMHQEKSIETPRFRITLAMNGGKLPLIMHENQPENLPEAYRLTQYKVNTEAIREALDNGEALEFAALGQRDSSIRIR